MNDVADLYGTSFPVRMSSEFLPPLLVDWMRHVGRGRFTVYELYPSLCQFLPEVPPGQAAQWLWLSVAAGARGVCFWQYKNERLGVEVNDAGLVEIDGSDNATTAAVGDALAQLAPLADDAATWRVPPGDVAVAYDFAADLVDRLEFTVAREGDLTGGYRLRVGFFAGHAYKSDLHGLYHLLWRAGFAVDFTCPERWDEEAPTAKALWLPAFRIIDEARARHLRAYVENGGTLLVDAGFGRRRDNTMLHARRPGAGLDELFGFREVHCVQLPGKNWELAFADGARLAVPFEKVAYAPAPDTEVLARWIDDGAPAAVLRNVGRGRVLALGCLPGLAAGGDARSVWRETRRALGREYDFPDPAPWSDALARLLERHADVRPSLRSSWPGVMERRLEDVQGRTIRFAFRRLDGDDAPDDAAWNAISRPGAETLVDSPWVRAWRES